jgi:hypothetical protein
MKEARTRVLLVIIRKHDTIDEAPAASAEYERESQYLHMDENNRLNVQTNQCVRGGLCAYMCVCVRATGN